MIAFLALIRRELIEHRGAFLYAPAAIVAFVYLVVPLALLLRRLESPIVTATFDDVAEVFLSVPVQLFEFGFLAFGGLWGIYLLGALFFYCAGAFSADRRNNALLFWKSMPQSDFKILLSKFAAAMTLFPALIYAAALLTGILVFIVVVLMMPSLGGNIVAFAGAAVWAYLEVGGALLLTFVLALLWYAPLLAWVGVLSTVVGRWSMPLSLLIPALLIFAENVFRPGLGASGGHIWSYLLFRAGFPLFVGPIEDALLDLLPFSFSVFAADFLSRFEWTQMAIGWVFAGLAIYAASQYRRRVLLD